VSVIEAIWNRLKRKDEQKEWTVMYFNYIISDSVKRLTKKAMHFVSIPVHPEYKPEAMSRVLTRR
jgi:hypothetical protein